MTLNRWAIVVLVAAVASACVRTSEGVPVAAMTGPATTPQPSNSASAGVVPTTRMPLPADAVTCSQPVEPGVRMLAEVGDPQAPRVTVNVPEGWAIASGSGDVGGRLEGPERMRATVTIVATSLDPAAAFGDYADRLSSGSAVSSISVLPAELCGYSGQKLIGALSDPPQPAVQFTDRVVAVWTNTRDYLVAVHVEAPSNAAGFDAAAAKVTGDFEVGIP